MLYDIGRRPARSPGKSWLFRRFAHGKPATILVAERLAPGAQLTRLAAQLEPTLGVRPEIADVAELFRLIYRLAPSEPHLVVLDEFPYLLPATTAGREELLTAIQAVMEEERDGSEVKLVLCGSYVMQMQALMSEGSALRGRLTALRIDPLRFGEAGGLIAEPDSRARIERYAVAGGMARYLAELGVPGAIKELISERMLDPNGALFNDPREVLEHELAQVATYFSILQELSTGDKALGEIAGALRMPATNLPRPLETLREMAVIERRTPINARASEKSSRYRITDPFLRFWFRFVFPYQEDLAAGLSPRPSSRSRSSRSSPITSRRSTRRSAANGSGATAATAPHASATGGARRPRPAAPRADTPRRSTSSASGAGERRSSANASGRTSHSASRSSRRSRTTSSRRSSRMGSGSPRTANSSCSAVPASLTGSSRRPPRIHA